VQRRRPVRAPQAGLIFLVALVLAALAGSARACDTPVFRYAMYSPQWAPWPYVVFSFSDGQQRDKDAEQVHQRLLAADRAKDGGPNLRFVAIDPADAAGLDELPPAVRKLHGSRPDKRPFHVVLNPRGEVVYSGGLTAADADTLLDSPARRELGRLMSHGNVVFLLLEGKDAKANAAAESTVNEVIRLVGEGRLDGLAPTGAAKLGAADLVPVESKDGASKSSGSSKASGSPKASAAPQTTPKVALLKVSRSDAKEAWLVRMLMRADQELDEVADRPMVFPVYGRARALPPCIGAGITQENLLDERFGLRFLAGPCSCEVKDGNPGTDLLTSIDWPAAATSMARVYGDEESADRMGDVTSLVPRLDALPGSNGGERAPTGNSRPSGGAGEISSGPPLPNLNPPEAVVAAETPSDSTIPAGTQPANPSLPSSQPSAVTRSLRPVGIVVASLAAIVVLASLLFFWPGKR
jgi:hypothetical protein